MSPFPNTRLVCISNFSVSTYSGMLPGVLAGDYEPSEMTIDLVKLCSAAGATLILDDVVGLDRDQQRLLFISRPPLPFDVLCVGIGSVPTIEAEVERGAPLVPIKPMQTFQDRLSDQLNSVMKCSPQPGIKIAIVGGGVAGVEVAMCLPGFLSTIATDNDEAVDTVFNLTLIQKNDDLLPAQSRGLRDRARQRLSERNVEVLCGQSVERVATDHLAFNNGKTVPADVVIWATGAKAPELLRNFGLPTDERGFLLTNRTLRTTADLPIFAVGDSGTIDDEHLPKAGVYAVRQGPVLWENLRQLLDGQPLKPYRPQGRFLKLLNCGDGTAIGEYGSISFQGAWAWKLKDWIDTRFVEKFQNLPAMDMAEAETPMRCHGCGSKIASGDLFDVLGEVGRPDDLPVGMADYDDAAVIRVGNGQDLVLTTDFFPMPLDDAYLSGRIAALHAMNDIYAMGAEPTAAMALVTLPSGQPRDQRRLLQELLHGAQQEFEASGTSLAGGHTSQGFEATIGFSIVGDPWGARVCRKGSLSSGDPKTQSDFSRPLQPSDLLLLTKPLGTGVLLAAYRRAECEADWYSSLLDTLLSHVEHHARLAWKLGAHWMTDVSGFGLSNHLLELLRGQLVSAEIDLSTIPLLPGSAELSASGIESSLYAANREAAISRMHISPEHKGDSRLRLLFDPQTCGGLLIALPEEAAIEFLQKCEADSPKPVAIGRIISGSEPGCIEVTESSGTHT